MISRLFIRFSLAALGALLCGCAAPQPRTAEPAQPPAAKPATESKAAPPVVPPAAPPAPAMTAAATPSADPLGYLRRVYESCTKLQAYRLTFVRQERRGIGLLKSLRDPERIECWYRRSPFSVRMKWLDPDIKYGESTYVQGREEDRLRFTPRPQLFNLPYRLYRVSPLTPVNWGECRYPVTDFGVEILMRRTLETIAADPAHTRVTYVGSDTAPGTARITHRIRIDYPPEKNPAPIQELFIDSASGLPVYTEMRFADGAIDTAYSYLDLDANVSLTDADFLLEYERTAAAASAP